MPIALPKPAAKKAVKAILSRAAFAESAEAWHRQTYQKVETSIADARNRDPIAHPQASIRFTRVVRKRGTAGTARALLRAALASGSPIRPISISASS
jgi:hypothetical protein